MIFNSLSFTLFLVIVFILYWFLVYKNLKFQNILLLLSSYFFYACWDFRFLFLLIFSTLLDYSIGLIMSETRTKRVKKTWFWLSICINLGLLGVFKYYNFFATSFSEAISQIGFEVNPWTLKIILPIGISFYTFHGLSYVIDIYKNRIKAEKNFVAYSVFVSFFPLLVAGPIERATNLLPQIKEKKTFKYHVAIDGLKQILWGLFKKVVIADNCAKFANVIFENSVDYSGSTLVLGAVLFTFQIYGDFSGYSDIAIGTARLFGIDLLKNFSYPYFSRDIAEFWRRWHISLSSWFKDYVYIPLGGSKGSTWLKIRNTFIIFLLSGFWHGANWTFIVWGLLNAIYILPSILLNTNRNHLDIVAKGNYFPSVKEFLSMGLTFCLTVFAWIFFRSENISGAFEYIHHIFSNTLFKVPYFTGVSLATPYFILIFFFFLIEWIGRDEPYAIANIFKSKPKTVRIAWYYFLLLLIFLFAGSNQQFIYFQF